MVLLFEGSASNYQVSTTAIKTGTLQVKKVTFVHCNLEYNPNTGLDVLKVQPVSKAQARQRLGRAGRQSPGQCYRLYTEEQFYSLQNTTTPEIQRCNLSSVVLQLMALGIKDVTSFEFLDAPLAQAIQNAIEQLKLLGALGQEKGEVR